MPVEGADERAWHFKQFRRSLERLAASAEDQNLLFPDLAVTADELALDFDHWAAVVCEAYGSELTGAQRAAIERVAAVFRAMSRDASEFDADVWTDAALRTSAHWASVRQLATAALEAFGWLDDSAALDAVQQPTDIAE